MSAYELKLVEPQDNGELKSLILGVLDKEFGYTGSGYASGDSELNDMYSTYTKPTSGYFVVKREKKLYGGCGFAPLKGTTEKVCELQKMYLSQDARGCGLGEIVLRTCLDQAKKRGYSHCYLETTKMMTQAQKLYKKLGFTECSKQGNTGHDGCDLFFIKDLGTFNSKL